MNCQRIQSLNCFMDEFESVVSMFAEKKASAKKRFIALDSQVNALNIAVNIINSREEHQDPGSWTFDVIAKNYIGYKNIYARFKTTSNILRNNLESKKTNKVVDRFFLDTSPQFYQALENQFCLLEAALKTCKMKGVIKLELGGVKPQRGATSSRIQVLQKIIEPSLCNHQKILKAVSSPSLENKPFAVKEQQNHNWSEEIEVVSFEFHQKKIDSLLAYLDNATILETEGLFRVSPSQNELLLVETEMNKNLKAVSAYEVPKESKVHVISSLLKSAIRETPFPQDFTEGIIAVVENDMIAADERKAEVIRLFQNLTKSYQEMYTRLFGFLNRVVDHQASNKMNSYNIAVVFALNFFPLVSSKDVMDAASKGEVRMKAILLLLEVLPQLNCVSHSCLLELVENFSGHP